jgi:2,3-bisphosphoglycerate-dependent phosphoglycerate mutase
MAYLLLLRHGESVWNKKGIWTGLTDVSLSDKGKEEAKSAANLIKNISLDFVFTSPLKRATETYEIIKKELSLSLIQKEHTALNERDYGSFTGKNKWEIQKEVGEDQFLRIRRGWNAPIPNGETLKDVYDRVVPYFQSEIEPLLKNGKNVLIVAHGNSLRALVKYLEHVSDDDVSKVEFTTGQVWVYDFDENGTTTSKKILNS